MIERLAQVAYEEHQIQSGMVHRGGGALPRWDDCENKHIWRSVVRTVLTECAADAAQRIDDD